MKQETTDGRWRFWIDVGGTFTDCFGISPTGRWDRCKVLSSARLRCRLIRQDAVGKWQVVTSTRLTKGVLRGFDGSLLHPDGRVFARGVVASQSADGATVFLEMNPERVSAVAANPLVWAELPREVTAEFSANQLAPLLAMRLILGLGQDVPLPAVELRLGTTRGTNALLTRSGARTAFVTTLGFRDALEIGDQQRPDLFALRVTKSPPLYETAVEVAERLAADGVVLRPLDPKQATETFERLKEQGIESLAICLLHAYRNPQHELQLRKLAEPFQFRNISLSHRCSPLIRFVPRSSTTVLDAYLNPVLHDYIAEIEASLGPQGSLLMMTSSGGLVPSAQFSGKDSVLSGPAGGVVGFSTVARSAGYSRAIGFDMGGTSTDVARMDGQVALQNETRKAGVMLQTPTLAIETVAAGGGSVCWFDGQRLLVGPQSAGADPGPACYGRGGPLTITDMNVWLGRIRDADFPVPLARHAVAQALEALAASIAAATGRLYSTQELATAYLQIANSHVAAAIGAVSIRQGLDPREYPIVAFGGAAAQQVCGVAAQLGVDEVLVHPDSALLSAYGIGHAELRRIVQKHLAWPVDDRHLGQIFEVETTALRTQAIGQLPTTDHESVRTLARVWVHVAGTEQCLVLELPTDHAVTAEQLRQEFWREFAQRFGVRWERPLQLATLEVEVVVPSSVAGAAAVPQEFDSLAHDSLAHDSWAHGSEPLGSGPQLIDVPNSTIWLEPNWTAERNSQGVVRLRRGVPPSALSRVTHPTDSFEAMPVTHNTRDPMLLELFCQRLTEIATQMGLTLQATCSSVNVKERLDFSCAVFDRAGDLLVNAPHIPVHLGAMSETVKSIRRLGGPFAASDVFVTNDPFQGGSHLPDVTVVTPVFVQAWSGQNDHHDGAQEAKGEPEFWVASRAHHAEIGGVTPGSMPPFATCLEQEGVVLRNLPWTTANSEINPAIRQALEKAKHPSRSPETNLRDIQAQVAANALGRDRLQQFVADWGWPRVDAYTRHVQDSAAEHTLALLQGLTPGRFTAEDRLDCGLTIRLAVTITKQGLLFDFTGTDPVRANNFNTNPAIVQSAILYCLRVLIGAPIPLNEGVLRPIEIRLPTCFLNPLGEQTPESIQRLSDDELPAVGGGNVETSQRIVDVIFQALQSSAASQGTMNNFLFGDDSFGFYETMGGGCGATSEGDGAAAVHSHMSNTRLTDPEVLETRYPVRLLEFRVRTGSGGDGRHRGGDGMVRRFEFLRPVAVSLVTNRRSLDCSPPYGMNGGAPGMRGLNLWQRPDCDPVVLGSSCQFNVAAGEVVEIQTPGGGGWGATTGDSPDQVV